MSWIMTMRRTENPIAYSFAIGTVEVAEITFSRGLVWLRTMNSTSDHKTMTEAMKEMHVRLNSPAPEGYEARPARDRKKVET